MAQLPGKTPITVDDILAEDLYGLPIRARGEAGDLPPERIARALRAAEDFYERDLGIFLGLKRVKSDPIERGLDPSTFDVADPAYDYESGMFTSDLWGRIDLNYRPVAQVDKLFFSYPGTGFTSLFDVPASWIRLDRKFGDLKIVPNTGAALLAMSGYLLSVFAGGRSVPRSIFIDYTAGLDPDKMEDDHAELLEGIRMRTVLNLMPTIAAVRGGGAGSHSISQDGQSQSESFAQGKYGPYSGSVELLKERETEIRSTWVRQEHGVPFVVC